MAALTPAPLFHATSYAAVGRIAAQGLQPTAGGGTFRWGSYAGHSAGKVFLAADPFAARAWFSKVEQAIEHNAGDFHGEGDDDLEEHAERIVPVLLRIHGRWRTVAKVDPLGDRDIAGSLYVERAIPPQDIEWWTGRAWAPLSTWGARPATAATKRVCEGRSCWLELRDRAVFHPGLPDPQFWGIKARQAGYPDGVEIVGLPGGGLGGMGRRG